MLKKDIVCNFTKVPNKVKPATVNSRQCASTEYFLMINWFLYIHISIPVSILLFGHRSIGASESTWSKACAFSNRVILLLKWAMPQRECTGPTPIVILEHAVACDGMFVLLSLSS